MESAIAKLARKASEITIKGEKIKVKPLQVAS